MPLQATSGAASYDAFGGGVAAVPNYIEDVFSTYLYTGNGSTQTITNGIDLSTKGGLTWIKGRSGATGHRFTDTARGVTKSLASNSTAAEVTESTGLTAFGTTGFTIGADADYNTSAATYASWTFRKQPKFFDVVTYTGNGTAGRQIAHNLGSVPGVIIVKCTDTAGEPWYVYHRSLGATKYLTLNTTNAANTSDEPWYNTEPTSTNFTVAQYNSANGSGKTYVAYLFAHNAGGFGLTGTDNVISCGSYTGNGSATGPVVTLGYEPQWVLVKSASGTTANWFLYDTMRGFPTATGSETRYPLIPNSTDAEATYASTSGLYPTSTGFSINTSAANFNQSGATYIYIAIRRGPMKVPTSGTSVFAPVARSGTGSTSTVSNSITTDLIISMTRNTAGIDSGVWDRLRGITKYLATTGTATESTSSDSVTALNNTSYVLGADTATDRINRSGYTYANWTFRRAPSFFDEVCYTGTGSLRTVSHNLGAVPELLIVKRRDTAEDWNVYSAATGNAAYLRLNTTAAVGTAGADALWGSTTPTSSVFTVKTSGGTNASGGTFVAYLFATCAGVSKVGSYTGTGTTLQVNCGFTGGARFVLIKRTDSTGDWYVWDSARGIVAGNDPYLLLNSTAAEVTSTDYIDTYSAGFEISSTAPAAINASGGTFIFLAIA